MKLSEHYHFFVKYNPATGGWKSNVTFAEADGVYFTCPKCPNGHGVLCWFAGRVPAELSPGPGRWTPSGTGIEDLTLTPSVHLIGEGCGWHGWVRNGTTVDC